MGTRHIAGNADQYGYSDAPLGLGARFSSPRGIINVRSVLFVADYWNNVVRCVNLYTTQVDTVLNFSPQGPVAMCLTRSGDLHCLDSDHIHYTNILRIMSTPGGHEVGTTSSQMANQYQSLFSAPRSRRDSATSCLTRTSEVWDTIRRQKVNFPGQPRVEVQITKPVEDLPNDFTGRLQAYLDQEDERK